MPDWASSIADTTAGEEDGSTTQLSRADTSPTNLSSPYVRGTTAETFATSSLAPSASSMHDSEMCLATFRNKMLPSFPFIYIGPDMTPQQLQRDRPFLLRAIIAVASPSRQQKLARGRELKQILAQTTLVKHQSSIDLLQGLLTFTAWSYDQVLNASCMLSRLIMLAVSLACELRLDKPLPLDEHMMKPMVDDSQAHENTCRNHWLVAEEQRAVLACYALSSMWVTFTTFRRQILKIRCAHLLSHREAGNCLIAV